MARSKTVPKFSSYEEAADWLDTHSTAYLETTPAGFKLAPNFKVRIVDSLDEAEILVSVDQNLSRRIRETAGKPGLSAEDLINHWLKEKADESQKLTTAKV